MPTTASFTYSISRVDPYMDPDNAKMFNVSLPNSINYAAGTVLGEVIGTNELQTLTIAGGGTGGTFTVTFSAQTTAGVAYNASAATLQAAMELLSTIGAGNVRVTGGPAGISPFSIEFVGTLAGTDVAAITSSVASITGGSPTQAVATVRAGAAGTTGQFKAYTEVATDGSQIAKAILVYAVSTDSSGNITITGTSSQAGSDIGQTSKSTPAYFSGTFLCSDLTGLDTVAVGQLGRLTNGTVASGVLRIG
jgi:hypothetical protein